NAEKAIFHQWEMLEASGCIDNFRILAEDKETFRQGWFFADSDAFKWLEAASAILVDFPDLRLFKLVDEFIALIAAAQAQDGYLYTYNQTHFPGKRWVNLQIEHELYCHGHLIEAGVTHRECLGEDVLLKIAQKAADRIVADFNNKGPRQTPGHEEIEIALLRLYHATGEEQYLEMAQSFLERRGKDPLFAPNLLGEFLSNNRRVRYVERQKAEYRAKHPDQSIPSLPSENAAKQPPNIGLRFMWNALSGKFFQQHKPVDEQTVPVGHAVRFAYLETAAVMLAVITDEDRFIPVFNETWEHLVARRMYITGGIGSLPVIEGFGRDHEQHPEYAYAETCAALGCLFWNREMAKLTGEAQYSDLFEWQLYNAALVGMGLDGISYFYNNPLAADDNIQRRAWYEVPCCPSNLSRTFARLSEEVVRCQSGEVRIEQYISSEHELEHPELSFSIQSQFPWQGKVVIQFHDAPDDPFMLKLRQPSWATHIKITINDEPQQKHILQPEKHAFDPTQAHWIELIREWHPGDMLVVDFAMPVRILKPDERIRSCRGKAAIARGPLVYCLESLDNPGNDIFTCALDLNRLETKFIPDLLGGIMMIRGFSLDEDALSFIPYHLWGNRGPSQMKVFIDLDQFHRYG
ncbi:MAG: glycoside hydrolase family 127 protein, partial [Brevefilum sp.]